MMTLAQRKTLKTQAYQSVSFFDFGCPDFACLSSTMS